MIFTLSAIFDLDSASAAEIMDISPENYRQILSRTRKQLSAFMNDQCSLLNPENSCQCFHKANGAIKKGLIDPVKRIFHHEHLGKISDFIASNMENVNDALELRTMDLFRDTPMYRAPSFTGFITKFLNRPEVRQFINY